jgi:glycine betaine/proline transport system substrate-binding protein
VQFPEWTPDCYSDPKWGTNPDLAYDCGKPHGEIWKYGWAGMKDKWPVAYKITKAFQFGDDEMNALISQVDLDGKSIDDVADAWIAANKDKIKGWAGQ